MITDEQRLNRLVAMARRGRPVAAELEAELETSTLRPPPGFSTRIAARWVGMRRGVSAAEAWEQMSWWGTGVAGAACLLVIFFHQPLPEPTGFDLLLTSTPVRPLF